MQTCSQCNEPVGDLALSCTKCGQPSPLAIQHERTRKWRRLGIKGVVIFGLMGVINGFAGNGGIFLKLLLTASFLVIASASAIADATAKK